MDVRAPLVRVAIHFSDPAVSQEQFDQLQRDKEAAAATIRHELEQLARKHNVPLGTVEELVDEVNSVVDDLTFDAETGYREEISCRLDCLQSRSNEV